MKSKIFSFVSMCAVVVAGVTTSGTASAWQTRTPAIACNGNPSLATPRAGIWEQPAQYPATRPELWIGNSIANAWTECPIMWEDSHAFIGWVTVDFDNISANGAIELEACGFENWYDYCGAINYCLAPLNNGGCGVQDVSQIEYSTGYNYVAIGNVNWTTASVIGYYVGGSP